MKRLFNQKEVARLVSISEGQVRYWEAIGLIPHVDKNRGQLFFDFKRLVAFRTVKELLDQGIPLRRLKKCVQQLKRNMPDIAHPLSEMRIFAYGGQIVLCKGNMKFTPDGQLLIDFSPEPGTLLPLPLDTVENQFFQALESEEEERWEEAKERYETVLALKPDHVNSLVNLGNVLYQSGSPSMAEGFYRQALKINPNHVEANYNLANLLEERNDLMDAISLYQNAIREDSEFADAYYNLGRLLERMGNVEAAKGYWKKYLDLDSSSEWAEYIKKRIL